MQIRLASPRDVPEMMALESRNFVGNLTAAERSAGFISVLHPQSWFESAVAAGGIHVAVTDDGCVSGFIAVTAPPPNPSDAESPIIAAMLELAQTLHFNGKPIAQQRFALRGPVLIDRTARGRGLYSAFNSVAQQAYRERYDLAVLFVAADNARSMHTTTSKLGATSLAIFEVDSRQYHFMAYNFRQVGGPNPQRLDE